MGDLLRRIESAGDVEELSNILLLLAEHVQCCRDAGRTETRDLQEAAHCLSRMRLVLWDLERHELWSRGASKTMAERYAELECAIGVVSDGLRDSLHLQGHWADCSPPVSPDRRKEIE